MAASLVRRPGLSLRPDSLKCGLIYDAVLAANVPDEARAELMAIISECIERQAVD